MWKYIKVIGALALAFYLGRATAARKKPVIIWKNCETELELWRAQR
ncbi:MAG: hypothetical protein J0H02_15170 [Armatimonadetes bacterium]|nr:hypothetical protein [Armatimonadota bacterium]